MVKEALVEAAEENATWIGDRNPSRIDTKILKGARHFHVVRDGRDVLVSRVFHLFNRPNVTNWFQSDERLKANLKEFQNDPDFFKKAPNELLGHEQIVRESARGWAELVQFNLDVPESYPKLRIMTVRYEEMHRDTEAGRASMYEFLNLKPEHAKPLDEKTTPGFEEQPDKFYRKGAVGDWENYMTEQAREWFNDEAGEVLMKLGYSESLDFAVI